MISIAAAIVLIGGLLRFIGLDFGLPLQFHPDEHLYREAVAGFAESNTLEPRMYAYGGLAFYPLHAVLKAGHAIERAARPDATPRSFAGYVADERRVTLYQRGLSAALGTLTLLAVFLLGRALHSSCAGLLAALILALVPLHVRDSHFGVMDVPLGLLVALAFLCMARAAQRGSLLSFLAAGAAVGAAAAMKYLPGVLLVPLLLAAFLAARGRALRPGRATLAAALAALAALGAFLLGAPYTLLEFGGFRSGLAEQASLSTRATPFDLWPSLAYHAKNSLGHGLGWPLALLAAFGLLAAFFSRSRGQKVLAFGAVCYAAAFAPAQTAYVRYVIPLLPLLAVLAALGACRLFCAERSRLRQAAALLVVLACAAPAAWRSLSVVRLMRQETTLNQLARWAEAALPRGATIAATDTDLAACLLPRARAVPWDPPRLVTGLAEYLIVFDHPNPYVGTPRGAAQVLAAAASFERVAEFRATDEQAGSVECVLNDFYFYPLVGLAALARPGPNVAVFRLLPAAAPPAGERPALPPRDLAVTVNAAGAVRLSWSVDLEPALAGFQVRASRADPGAAAAEWGPACLPAHRTACQLGCLPPGAYQATVTPVGAGGEGPASEPLTFHVPDP